MTQILLEAHNGSKVKAPIGAINGHSSRGTVRKARGGVSKPRAVRAKARKASSAASRKRSHANGWRTALVKAWSGCARGRALVPSRDVALGVLFLGYSGYEMLYAFARGAGLVG